MYNNALSSLSLSAISEDDFSYLTDKASDKTSAYSEDGWQEEALNCWVCDRRFSAVSRRHHCRICSRSVCAKCSPNHVTLDGFDKVQRACTPCASYVQTGAMAKKRLAALSQRTWTMSGIDPPQEDAKTTEDALIRCELALTSLEERHRDLSQCTDLAEAELLFEQEAHQQSAAKVFASRNLFCQVAQELHKMNGGAPLNELDFNAMSIDEAMQLCEEALEVLKKKSGQNTFSTQSSSNSQMKVSPLARASCPDVLMSSPSHSPSRSMRELTKKDLEVIANVWAPDASNCSICDKLLGKRYFKPRHHCRSCGRCVCSSCSPNAVLMEGAKHRQRICIQCEDDGVQKRPPVCRTRSRSIPRAASPHAQLPAKDFAGIFSAS
mmetsp:Transcript_10185/g.16705  ORF Transcript_10185/g.16705 Transcript_10185/m.16705 type:complete len:380 (-) Transcript_10185:259-1398(-)